MERFHIEMLTSTSPAGEITGTADRRSHQVYAGS